MQVMRALDIHGRGIDAEMLSKDSIAEGTLYQASGDKDFTYSMSLTNANRV